MRQFRYPLYFFYLVYFFSSCTNNEIGNSRDVNPDAVFFEYQVWGEEKDSTVTVYLQYRMGGRNGTTLVLNEPSRVQLDGEELPADSARLSGAFYVKQVPAESFAGKHIISFTDLNRKQYKEEFTWQPFKLKTKIPDSISRGDLAFDFEGLQALDHLRVIATDTSFRSRDINEIDTVRNGRIIIAANKLNDLVNGPITLLFYKEVELPVKNGTKEGGKISVTYGLQREVELRD